jgi:tRNA G18 (ribose-2'-O)-methylase SpoU
MQGLYDIGNVSAVLRSAEAFGIEDIYLINRHDDKFKVARSISVGAEKWLRLHHFSRTDTCIAHLQSEGYHVAVAHCPSVEPAATENSTTGASNSSDGDGSRDALIQSPSSIAAAAPSGATLTDLDLTQKTAVVFGNEFAGMTEEAIRLARDHWLLIDATVTYLCARGCVGREMCNTVVGCRDRLSHFLPSQVVVGPSCNLFLPHSH